MEGSLTKEEHISHLISRVFATEEEEPACDQVQTLLPEYVDALVNRQPYASIESIEVHLVQCSDCRESFEALHRLVTLEQETGLPDAAVVLADWETDAEMAADSSPG